MCKQCFFFPSLYHWTFFFLYRPLQILLRWSLNFAQMRKQRWRLLLACLQSLVGCCFIQQCCTRFIYCKVKCCIHESNVRVTTWPLIHTEQIWRRESHWASVPASNVVVTPEKPREKIELGRISYLFYSPGSALDPGINILRGTSFWFFFSIF